MNILFIKHFFVRFMVSQIPRVSVFGHCPYSVTCIYIAQYSVYHILNNIYIYIYIYILNTIYKEYIIMCIICIK